MKNSKTPIIDFLTEYAASGTARLHMPGHKGFAPGCIPKALQEMYRYDITEIAGADDLFSPEGIIAESEEIASRIYGAKTFYSCEGSSLAIKAMLYLSLKHFEGKAADKGSFKPALIVLGKNHKALYHGAELLNIEVFRAEFPEDELSAKIKELQAGGFTVIGVYVTYPDYFGNITDLRAIKEAIHPFNIPLLVDGAHAAYFKFLKGEFAKDYPHPIDCGADMVCASAHKTLPALTGAAYLHISDSMQDVIPLAKHAMDIFGSSSPSYLIMASLDGVNGVAKDFEKSLEGFCKEVKKLKEDIAELGFDIAKSDPMRITVRKSECFNGSDFANILRKHGCEPECFAEDYVILMLSPYNRAEDLI
ncbi:MAG: amino acid decarboxylase, partial [Lachnospiraceae bacterium]|nr:amino acid decarboxylase [Lachnospiraceae bacterium]